MAPQWKSIVCPLCKTDTGDGRTSCSLHIATHLEEIALAAIPASCGTDEDNDSDREEATDHVDDLIDWTTPDLADLNRHKIAKHQSLTSFKEWKCTGKNCRNANKIWPRFDNFKVHIQKMHPDEDLEEVMEKSLIESSSSSNGFLSLSADDVSRMLMPPRKTATRSKPSSSVSPLASNTSTISASPRNSNNIKLTCELCHQQFSTLKDFARHKKSIHESKKYRCDTCGRMLGRPDSLKRHKRSRFGCKRRVQPES
jgi:C2H2 type zinc finger protein